MWFLFIVLTIAFIIGMIDVNGKIKNLKNQLDERTKELRLLSELVMRNGETQQIAETQRHESVITSANKPDLTVNKLSPEQMARFEEFKRQKENQNNQNKIERSVGNKNNDFENVFGKHILGYLAAILVFIGMLAFGSLIFNYVGDVLKTVMTFLFSFAITGFGVFMHLRNKNAFSESVMGCGVGTIFISIFISHLFFGTFNDIIAFALILIWAIGVFVLSRKVASNSLLYISHIGCLISIFMAMGSSFEERMVEIVVYQLLTIVILLLLDKRIENGLSKITSLTAMLMNNILLCCCYDELFFGDTKIFIMIALTSLSTCILHVLNSKKNYFDKITESIISIVLFAFNICMLLSSIVEIMTDVNYLVLNVVAVFVVAGTFSGIVLTTYNDFELDVNLLVMLPFLATLALYSSSIAVAIDYAVTIPGVLFYAAILLALYARNKKNSYLVVALIMLFIDGFAALFMLEELALFFYLSILVLITFVASYEYKKNIFSLGLVSLGMIDTLWASSLIMLLDCTVKYENTCVVLPLVLIIISIINIAFRYLFKEYANEEHFNNTTRIIIDIVLHIIIIVNCFAIGATLLDDYSTICYILLLVLSILNFSIGMIGLTNVFENEDNAFGVIYAIKFTILTIMPIFQFTSLLDEQFIFSIVLMVLATVCILFGFKFKNKSTRIYGLSVLLMSVIKIVIVDMWGQDSIIRVVALMFGGVICFAISALYNKFEKRFLWQQEFKQSEESFTCPDEFEKLKKDGE